MSADVPFNRLAELRVLETVRHTQADVIIATHPALSALLAVHRPQTGLCLALETERPSSHPKPLATLCAKHLGRMNAVLLAYPPEDRDEARLFRLAHAGVLHADATSMRDAASFSRLLDDLHAGQQLPRSADAVLHQDGTVTVSLDVPRTAAPLRLRACHPDGARHILALEPADGTPRRVAVLPTNLAPGKWRIQVETAANQRVRRPLFALHLDTTVLAGDSGHRFLLRPCRAGGGELEVRAAPKATVHCLHVTCDPVEGAVLLRLAAPASATAPRLHLVHRKNTRSSVALPPDETATAPGELSFRIPVGVLAARRRVQNDVWDIRLEPRPGATRLPLIPDIPDITEPNRVYNFPHLLHEAGPRGRSRYRVHYAANGTLILSGTDDSAENLLAAVPLAAPEPLPQEPCEDPEVQALTRRERLLPCTPSQRPAGPRRDLTDARAMKIAYLHRDVSGMGGAIRAALSAAGQFAQDHQAEIIAAIRTTATTFFDTPPGVTIRALTDVRIAPSPADAYHPDRGRPPQLVDTDIAEEYFPVLDALTEARILQYLDTTDADVVIATHPILAVLLNDYGSDRYYRVTMEYALGEQTYGPNQSYFDDHQDRLDALVTVGPSDVVVRNRRGSQHTASRLVLPIPCSVPDSPLPASRQQANIIMMAGRLIRGKRYDLALRAFARIAPQHPDWQLRLYGRGKDRARLQDMVDSLGLHHQILLMGAHRRLAEEWAKASFSVCTSVAESQGIGMVESLQAGVPVLSVDVPNGPREVLTDGHDSLLVPDNDEDALAQGMELLIQDEELRRSLGRNAAQSALRYADKHDSRQFRNLFQSLSQREQLPGLAEIQELPVPDGQEHESPRFHVRIPGSHTGPPLSLRATHRDGTSRVYPLTRHNDAELETVLQPDLPPGLITLTVEHTHAPSIRGLLAHTPLKITNGTVLATTPEDDTTPEPDTPPPYCLPLLFTESFTLPEQHGGDTGHTYNVVLTIEASGQYAVHGTATGPADSTEHWHHLLRPLTERGVTDLLMIASPQAPAAEQAALALWPRAASVSSARALLSRCLELAGDLNQDAIRIAVQNLCAAPDEQTLDVHLDALATAWEQELPSVVQECLDNRDMLVALCDHPPELRRLALSWTLPALLRERIMEALEADTPDEPDPLLDEKPVRGIIHSLGRPQASYWPQLIQQMTHHYPGRPPGIQADEEY
ncbi:glycosyltransferase [Streptomyces fractus]|uniref:glycosyltransferase n=1 Tax=Streptomyces fractus TaxID=641806 RepID=UPI003CFA89D2